jgi:hypothetical protein
MDTLTDLRLLQSLPIVILEPEIQSHGREVPQDTDSIAFPVSLKALLSIYSGKAIQDALVSLPSQLAVRVLGL